MLYFAWQPLSKLPRFPALAECMSDVEPDTRQMVRAQNKKKKKSGGFQSMGETQWRPLVTSTTLVLCSWTAPGTKSTSFSPLCQYFNCIFLTFDSRSQFPCVQRRHEERLQSSHSNPKKGALLLLWAFAISRPSTDWYSTHRLACVSFRPSLWSWMAKTLLPWRGPAAARRLPSWCPCLRGWKPLKPKRGPGPSSWRPPESWPCRPWSSPKRSI